MKILIVLSLIALSVVTFAQSPNSIATNPGTASRTLTADQKKGLVDTVAKYNAAAQAAWDAVEALKPVGSRVAYAPVTADNFLLDAVVSLLTAWEADRRARVSAEPTVKEISDKLATLKVTKRAAILAAVLAEQEP